MIILIEKEELTRIIERLYNDFFKDSPKECFEPHSLTLLKTLIKHHMSDPVEAKWYIEEMGCPVHSYTLLIDIIHSLPNYFHLTSIIATRDHYLFELKEKDQMG